MASGTPVQILVSRNPGECDAGCGMDWTAEESLSLAAGWLKDRFGEDISIERIDITEDKAGLIAGEWAENIKNGNLSLPLLLVNGRVRISGQFDIRQLIDVIEAERELGGL